MPEDGESNQTAAGGTLVFPSMHMKLAELELLDALKNGVRGDAKLFYKLFGGKLVYDHSAGEWYRFDGHFWRKDIVQQVLHDVDRISTEYECLLALTINRISEVTAENMGLSFCGLPLLLSIS